MRKLLKRERMRCTRNKKTKQNNVNHSHAPFSMCNCWTSKTNTIGPMARNQDGYKTKCENQYAHNQIRNYNQIDAHTITNNKLKN